MLFAYRDTTLHRGWPQAHAARGGEASQRLFDLERRQRARHRQADSSGELQRAERGRHAAGELQRRPAGAHRRSTRTSTPARRPTRRSSPPREVLRTPAIGDIDGDLEPEIVDTAGEHVYAWNADGSAVPGFPVRLDPALSRARRTARRDNHIKRGFIALAGARATSTATAALEIVAPALDQHVYAWDGQGQPLPGFPAKLGLGRRRTAPRSSPRRRRGHHRRRRPEIVVPTHRVRRQPGGARHAHRAARPGRRASGAALTNILANALGGSGRMYALDAQRRRAARLADRSRTASSRTRCRSSAPAWTTCWRTWTATRSSR